MDDPKINSDQLSKRIDHLEQRIDTQTDVIKERETSLLRAIKTLVDDYSATKRGEDKDMRPALMGLAYAYFHPRVFLVIGSIAGLVFAFTQVWLMVVQYQVMDRQSGIMEQQNLLSTINLSSQLETILSTGSLTLDDQVFYTTGNDEVEVGMGFPGKKVSLEPANYALEVVHQLGSTEQLQVYVINALRPLLTHELGSISTAALLSLEKLGVDQFERVEINNLDRIDLELSGVSIDELYIDGLVNGRLTFSDCSISSLTIFDTHLNSINFTNCTIESVRVRFSGIGNLTFQQGEFRSILLQSSVIRRLSLNENTVLPWQDNEEEVTQLVDNDARNNLSISHTMINYLDAHPPLENNVDEANESCIGENLLLVDSVNETCQCEVPNTINYDITGELEFEETNEEVRFYCRNY